MEITIKKFFSYTPDIAAYLQEFLQQKKTVFAGINGWGEDVADKLHTFAIKGKFLRGNCLINSYRMFGGEAISEVLPAADALELLHSGLLIHDDIIDNDMLRRGEPSMFAQYQQQGFRQAKALALCLGDMTFFMAYELLNLVKTTPEIKQHIIQKVSYELPLVGLGQMQDVAPANKHITEHNILQTFRYKTARYTFSLPFALGALLAGANTETVDVCESFGEQLGILFQIKDDEIGMFGQTDQIGKPAGSDIREGKKTLYYLYLMETAALEEKEQLQHIFGNQQITNEDVHFVHECIQKYAVDKKIEKLQQSYLQKIYTALDALPIAQKNKELLYDFVTYNVQREK